MLYRTSRFLPLIAAVMLCVSAAATVQRPAAAEGKPRVYVTKKGNSYHKQDCPTIKGSEVTKTTRKDAEAAGKKPCKVCKP